MSVTIERARERSAMSETGDLIEMDGPHGRFGIAEAGGKPDYEHAYLYHDEKHHFFFYIDFISTPDRKFRLVVKHATIDRFQGPIPRVQAHERPQVEANIEAFFQTHNFMFIDRLITDPAWRPEGIAFNWSLRS